MPSAGVNCLLGSDLPFCALSVDVCRVATCYWHAEVICRSEIVGSGACIAADYRSSMACCFSVFHLDDSGGFEHVAFLV